MDARSEEGQSVMEFMIILPVLVGFFTLLLKVNSAIQVSIVDQQYARAQTLFLTFNNPFYPEKKFQETLIKGRSHQMLLGVSDNQAAGTYNPKAAVQTITRTKQSSQGVDTVKVEPNLRGKVRVRNTTTLCTRNLTIKGSQAGAIALLPMNNDRPGSYNLDESRSADLFRHICTAGVLGYEQ